MLRSMMIEDNPEVIKSVLGEEDLVRIQEEFNIPVSIRLELLGPFEWILWGW